MDANTPTPKPVEWLTPPTIAKELHCRASKPIAWIRSGKLAAVNLSEGSRARYLVRREDLDEFLQRRQVTPPPPTVRKQRRGDVPRYV
jgi:excisionase family DNA binding protein